MQNNKDNHVTKYIPFIMVVYKTVTLVGLLTNCCPLKQGVRFQVKPRNILCNNLKTVNLYIYCTCTSLKVCSFKIAAENVSMDLA